MRSDAEISGDGARVAHPLFQTGDGGSIPASSLQVPDLIFEPCSKRHCMLLNYKWHSRLPKIPESMCRFAFHARHGDITYAVALWSNPVARLLPQHWLELRRMACAPDAPHNAASAFLGWMVRWLRKRVPECERLISYQDTEVHAGTIYKASGWLVGALGASGDTWDRPNRYRPNANGDETIASAKIRWEKTL